MMSVLSTHSCTDWRLWGSGVLVSVLACFTCPVGDIEYGLLGSLTLLFYWGLLRSE